MKTKLLLAMTLMLMTQAVGCTTKTQYGDCIGAFDEANPKLVYKASVKNVVLAGLFSGTIFVPVLVILDETKCPVGTK